MGKLLSECSIFVIESLNSANAFWDRRFLCLYLILQTANQNPPSQATFGRCGCHHRAWPVFQDDQTQSISDFDFMITALVYLFHQYFFFFFGQNWHTYSTCLFIPQFKTSPYPWVWISWILQRFGWIREYHCIPIIRPEPILVIYLCALMWLRYKVSFIPRGCLWVRLRHSFFRSNWGEKKKASRCSDAVKSYLKTACDWIYGCFMWAMRFS